MVRKIPILAILATVWIEAKMQVTMIIRLLAAWVLVLMILGLRPEAQARPFVLEIEVVLPSGAEVRIVGAGAEELLDLIGVCDD